MGKWGHDDFVINFNLGKKGGLYTAITHLNSKAKQAFYGAAMKLGVIEQGTWNGCAFNAGGNYVGVQGISSYAAAAEAFGLTNYVVETFIEEWDKFRSPDEKSPTEHLIQMLENVGLFEDNPRVKITTYSHRIYTSEETEAIEALRAEIESGAFLAGMQEACDLLIPA